MKFIGTQFNLRHWLLAQCLFLILSTTGQDFISKNNYLNLNFKKALIIEPSNELLAKRFNEIVDTQIIYLSDYYGDTAFFNLVNIKNNQTNERKIYMGQHLNKLVGISFDKKYWSFLFKNEVLVYDYALGVLVKKMKVPKGYHYAKIKNVDSLVYVYYYTSKQYTTSKIRIIVNNIIDKKDNSFSLLIEQLNPHSSPLSAYGNYNYICISSKLMVISSIHDYNITIKSLESNTDDTLYRKIFNKPKNYYKKLKYASDKYSLSNSYRNFDNLCAYIEKNIVTNVTLVGDSILLVQYLEEENPYYDLWIKKKNWILKKQNIVPYFVHGKISKSNYPIWHSSKLRVGDSGVIVTYHKNYKPILGLLSSKVYSQEFYNQKGRPAFIIYDFNNVFSP